MRKLVSGVMQSPINIMLSVVEESDKLHQVTFKYTAPWETQANSEPQPTTVKNNGSYLNYKIYFAAWIYEAIRRLGLKRKGKVLFLMRHCMSLYS